MGCQDLESQVHPQFVKRLKHIEASSGQAMPSLSFSNGGPVLFLTFDNKVVITTPAKDIDFEETLPFKKHRVVGFGVDCYCLHPRP